MILMPSIRKKGKKINPEKEVKRLSKKTNINIYESNLSFENRLKKVDKDIDKALSYEMKEINGNIDRILSDETMEFDENKDLLSQYIQTDFGSEYERLKRKLRKI